MGPSGYYPIDVGTIPVYRGDAEGRNKVTVLLLDGDGNPVNMAVFGTTWTAKASDGTGTIVLDVDDSQGSVGIIEAAIKVADSAGLAYGGLDFDIQVTGGDISPLTVYAGKFDASGEVTTS